MDTENGAQSFADAILSRSEEKPTETSQDEVNTSEETTQEETKESPQVAEDQVENLENKEDLTPATEEKKQEEVAKEVKEKEAEPTVEKEAVEEKEFIDVKEWLKENKENLWLLDENLDEVDLSDNDNIKWLYLNKLTGDEGYTDEEALLYLENKFPETFGEDANLGSKESRLEVIEAKRVARDRVAKLKEIQTALEVPQVPKSGDTNKDSIIEQYVQEQTRTFEQQKAKQTAELTNVADTILNKFEKVNFEYGDNSFDVEVTNEIRKQAREYILNPVIAEAIGQIVKPSTKPLEQAQKEIMQTLVMLIKPELPFNIATKLAAAKETKDFIDNNLKHKDTITKKSSGTSKGIEITGNDPASLFARGLLAR